MSVLGTADTCGWVNFVALICREYFGSCLVAQVVIMGTFWLVTQQPVPIFPHCT